MPEPSRLAPDITPEAAMESLAKIHEARAEADRLAAVAFDAQLDAQLDYKEARRQAEKAADKVAKMERDLGEGATPLLDYAARDRAFTTEVLGTVEEAVEDMVRNGVTLSVRKSPHSEGTFGGRVVDKLAEVFEKVQADAAAAHQPPGLVDTPGAVTGCLANTVIEPDLERVLAAESDNDADDQVDPRDLYQVVHEPTIGQWLRCHKCRGNYDRPAPKPTEGHCHRPQKEAYAIRELDAELDLDWQDAPLWELDLVRTEVEGFEVDHGIETVGALCDHLETHGWTFHDQAQDRVLTAIIHFKDQIERNARKAMEAKSRADKPRRVAKPKASKASKASEARA